MTNDMNNTFQDLTSACQEIERLKTELAEARDSTRFVLQECNVERGRLKSENARLEELHVLQLAGIMTASIQNTDATVKDRITRENPYWTQAYEDVCRAVDREMALRKENARLAAELAYFLNANRPLPYPRETLGRLVREAWVAWAKLQPNPKPNWLLPYDELSESDKEADRRIGEHVARWILIADASSRSIRPVNTLHKQVEPTIELLERYIECRVGECEFVGLARIELARLRAACGEKDKK